MLRKALALTVLVLALVVPAAPAGSGAQSSIALPQDFRPEGIASGKGDSFYVGSIPSAPFTAGLTEPVKGQCSCRRTPGGTTPG